jgi:uncharacterized NAD-dependent epimerase/dehydratase family protein
MTMDKKNPRLPEGNAILYCEGAFNTTYGKTAHGLIRFTQRYLVISVVDSQYAGQDAGEVLDGKSKDIPVLSSVHEAVEAAREIEIPATHLVMGIAPDGGRLGPQERQDVLSAIQLGLNIDCGLHQFLTEDTEMKEASAQYDVHLRDIRKPPSRDKLHFFSGKIEEVTALKIAVLGTDSAIGKRTTAWQMVQGLEDAGYRAEMIGTGQTAWMQGAKYCIIMDSLVNDFISGEIEHAVWSAWKDAQPDVIVIEGQGSLMNPAYPGGFEILAAGRPDVIILQHAPMRKEYDGFPGYRLHPLGQQIEAVEMLSGKSVAAITINHENIPWEKIPLVCDALQQVTGLPTVDVLYHINSTNQLVEVLKPYLEKKQ